MPHDGFSCPIGAVSWVDPPRGEKATGGRTVSQWGGEDFLSLHVSERSLVCFWRDSDRVSPPMRALDSLGNTTGFIHSIDWSGSGNECVRVCMSLCLSASLRARLSDDLMSPIVCTHFS